MSRASARAPCNAAPKPAGKRLFVCQAGRPIRFKHREQLELDRREGLALRPVGVAAQRTRRREVRGSRRGTSRFACNIALSSPPGLGCFEEFATIMRARVREAETALVTYRPRRPRNHSPAPPHRTRPTRITGSRFHSRQRRQSSTPSPAVGTSTARSGGMAGGRAPCRVPSATVRSESTSNPPLAHDAAAERSSPAARRRRAGSGADWSCLVSRERASRGATRSAGFCHEPCFGWSAHRDLGAIC